MKIGLVVAVLAVPCLAAADPVLEDIRPGQSYAIDLYSGVPLGNSAVIATGGASQASSIGSSGTLVNPSAPAVRPTTDTDHWNWDYHLDYLFGSLSTDYANSGIARLPDGHASAVTFGASLRVGNWGGALTAGYHNTRIDDDETTSASALYAQSFQLKAAIAKWFPELDMAIGVSAVTALFDVYPDCPQCASLFSLQGAGGEAGAQWIPRRQSF
ncbi:MAG: hypothetical protein ABI678_31320, partial [Kofleriaceae bacterium]